MRLGTKVESLKNPVARRGPGRNATLPTRPRMHRDRSVATARAARAGQDLAASASAASTWLSLM